jgi:hypothetical protein
MTPGEQCSGVFFILFLRARLLARVKRVLGFCCKGNISMNTSKSAWAGVLAAVMLAGCASTGSTSKSDTPRRSTQQRQMSGTDSNYPSSGIVSGESGSLTIYSSEKAQARKEEEARQAQAALPSSIEPGSEEAKEFEAWRAQQNEAEYEAWKKEQADKAAAE